MVFIELQCLKKKNYFLWYFLMRLKMILRKDLIIGEASIHPKEECITVFYGYSQPYGYGWRYDDNGQTMFWYYKDVIREVFEYDKADKILKAQEDAKK